MASGPRDIHSALDGAFDSQEVDVEGGKAPQYSSISQLPPILQIQVQRVQFDPEKKSSFKSVNHLELKETIFLDRYMDTKDGDLMQRRRECWAWKAQMRELEERKKVLVETQVSPSSTRDRSTSTPFTASTVTGSRCRRCFRRR